MMNKEDGTNVFSINNSFQPVSFIISNADEAMVTISLATGDITFGPSYHPKLAARQFWSAISAEYREYLKWKKENER